MKYSNLKWLFRDFVHQCIAHPLLFITNESEWSVRFHDKTEVWRRGY